MNNYVEIVSLLHSGVQCHAKGPLYSDVVWKGAPIPKAALDAGIANIGDHRKNAVATRDIDGMKAFKALATETLIEINALRTNAGLSTISGAVWRQRLIDRYKTL